MRPFLTRAIDRMNKIERILLSALKNKCKDLPLFALTIRIQKFAPINKNLHIHIYNENYKLDILQ